MPVKFAQAHLSIIPLRAEASGKSELTSQMLFGELYTILEYSPDAKWAFIETEWDQYQAWIEVVQVCLIEEEAYAIQAKKPPYLCLDPWTSIQNEQGNSLLLVLGSRVPSPDLKALPFWGEGYRIQGTIKQIEASGSRSDILDIAKRYLNAPYLWGGKSPLGIDCSGLSQMVYRMAGINISRDARLQVQEGRALKKLADTQPGDLAFFSREGRTIHVGLILDEPSAMDFGLKLDEDSKSTHYILHAYDRVKVDKLDEQGIFNLESQEYTHELSALKTYF